MRRVELPDSGPYQVAGIKLATVRPAPAQVIRATVVLSSRCSEVELQRAVDRHNRLPPTRRPHLSEREFNRRFGPLRANVDRVVDFARAHHLRVREVSAKRHAVVLSGALDDFARAFDVEFATFQSGASDFLGHRSPVFVPESLSDAITAVLGFDDRPLSRPHAATTGETGGISPEQVARAYGFPRTHNLRGQTIAILLPYGGFRSTDLRSFFRRLGRRMPRIRTLEIDGRSNQPAPVAALRRFCERLEGRTPRRPVQVHGPGSSPWNILWTAEATLDIELAGALAPQCDLLVCFMPDTPRGKFEGITGALTHSTRPSALSMSWSAHEDQVPRVLLRELNRVFMFASLRNVSICCSSGDDGAAEGEAGHVHFPASSPYVIACGGTTYSDPARSKAESVWNEKVGGQTMSSSGGFSRVFPRPDWQRPHVRSRKHVRLKGRGVPDVAAKADFKRGYRLTIGGREIALGGTSAATPAWAALVACLNDALRTRIGFIVPWLYAHHKKAVLRSVTVGTNGTYHADRGWDPCTGLGTPVGDRLVATLAASGRRSNRGSRRRSARG